ncbi:MAG: hypothetical protein ACE5I1_11340 [bacterium]
MNTTKILLKLAFIGLLAATFGCESLFNDGVKGVALQVMQMQVTEVEQNNAQYALVLRQGDLVKLDVASE